MRYRVWPVLLLLFVASAGAAAPRAPISAYDAAIDRVVKTLPPDGMWTNGLTPAIDLASEAKPEAVIAEAVSKSFPARKARTVRVLRLRRLTFDPPLRHVSAALVQVDGLAKVLIFYPFPRRGWWTRFYATELSPKGGKPSTSAASRMR